MECASNQGSLEPQIRGGREEGVEQCQKKEECQGVCQDDNMICGGGNVIFNTSHQNHLDTISVELHWLCDKVPDRLACILRSTR